MYQPEPCKVDVPPSIFVYGKNLEVVDGFAYLGSTLSRSNTLDEAISAQITKCDDCGKLEAKIWSQSDITIVTEVSVSRVCVSVVLLHVCVNL